MMLDEEEEEVPPTQQERYDDGSVGWGMARMMSPARTAGMGDGMQHEDEEGLFAEPIMDDEEEEEVPPTQQERYQGIF